MSEMLPAPLRILQVDSRRPECGHTDHTLSRAQEEHGAESGDGLSKVCELGLADAVVTVLGLVLSRCAKMCRQAGDCPAGPSLYSRHGHRAGPCWAALGTVGRQRERWENVLSQGRKGHIRVSRLRAGWGVGTAPGVWPRV